MNVLAFINQGGVAPPAEPVRRRQSSLTPRYGARSGADLTSLSRRSSASAGVGDGDRRRRASKASTPGLSYTE